MKKTQVFSTDASVSLIFFLGIVTVFLITWDNQVIYASNTFENNLLEIKSFNLLDFLLSDPNGGIVNEYGEISYYKLNKTIQELNNDNYNKSDELGITGYDIVIFMQYNSNKSVIISSFDTITYYNYRITASRNALFEGESVRVNAVVSRV
ncbi:MAG: hypothetical protein JW791_01080 [Nanoarchaeota archaeon]|nr:hypothetical protein [Nanoarchaeota archaeon]